MTHRDHRFAGRITGVGSTSGVRLVVGHWDASPLGAFADVMVEDASRRRTLLAPSDAIAEFVSGTYVFDEIHVGPVAAQWSQSEGRDPATDSVCRVLTDRLDLTVRVGHRSGIGRVLHLVPHSLATSPAWCRLIDPFSRVLMPGVRTAGSAGKGRREFYGATDVHDVRALEGSFDGIPLGELADVWPPARFGFSSAPRRPAMTTVVTTVREA